MNANHEADIQTLLNERTSEVALIDGVQVPLMIPGWNIAEDVKQILKVAYQIIDVNEDAPFFVIKCKIRKQDHVGMTKFGKVIWQALKKDIDPVKEHFHRHKFHPLLELMIRKADEGMLFDLAWKIAYATDTEAICLASSFNSFYKNIQAIANSTEFKNKVQNFERSSRENLLQFNRYIDAHFEKRSRLLFVRIDVGYKESYIAATGNDIQAIYRRIKGDWSKFYFGLSRKILMNNLRGFVWKLEYGLKKSFHLHVLLIVDNSNLRSDITIAKIIGDFWEKDVTANCGDYFNCNAKKASYRFCGIGQVHRKDVEMRQALRNRVGVYLTKPDYVVALQAPGGGRTFGKGNMPN